MSAGIQTTQAQVNQNVGALALNLRSAMQAIGNFSQWLNAVSGATGLVALGFGSADADTIVSTVGNLQTLNEIYQGAATQATEFNYEANSNALWGGQ